MRNENKREKWVQICQIQGYEDVREWYWISNSDEDKIVNRSTGKILKISLNKDGYKRVKLRTIDKKQKMCKIHIIKAKAFIFGPNPLGANLVRHLNDCKTDNRLENLAFGTRSDNNLDCVRNGNYNYEASTKNLAIGAIKGGKISGKVNGKKTGAKNGRRSSKAVKCLETGVIYPSTHDAGRKLGILNAGISHCCNGKCKTAKGLHWEFVNKEE